MLQLKKPLAIIDLETTGVNLGSDRIVEIAIVKIQTDGTRQIKRKLLNPEIPISTVSRELHGISNEMVKDAPTFKQVANEIKQFLDNCDLAGYNSNRFDIPVLMEEFARAGIDFDIDSRRTIDVQRIFYKMEPRTLSAAYQFYCRKSNLKAHDAMEDVRATIEVLDGQLARYENADYFPDEGETLPTPIRNDLKSLSAFTNDLNMIDATQRLRYDHNGTVVFNFGKYIGRPVAEVLFQDPQYYHWMLNKEFSFQVKKIIKKLVTEYKKENTA